MRKFYQISFMALVACGVLAGASVAQTMAPPTPPLPIAKDIAYDGVIKIDVDATDLAHRIFKIHQTIPVSKAGDLILLVPKWLPGNHRPGSQLGKIAGLRATAGGKTLTWTRDLVAVNSFHIDVPAGVKSVEVDFEYLSPTEPRLGRIVMTQEMLNLQWQFASLYPAGHYVKRIQVQASVKYPMGWTQASGLEVQSISPDNRVTYKTTDYDTVLDSPIYAGRHFKSWDLDPGSKVPVRLNVVADRPELLKASDEAIGYHRNLVTQGKKLFGAHHYDHYDFLVSMSDYLGGNGLEHHRSSENGVDAKYFTEWKSKYVGRDLLPHEYAHSWNGKYRRGNDLWTPDFQTPMRDSLMWVYEGQTQYWGQVLAARSGLYSKEQALQLIAMTAATYDNTPGRAWRNLQDTTNDPIIASREPQGWRSYQRSEDYYSEGQLIWFDADTLIREKTGGKKSLDDFAKAFFGINNGDWGEATYDFAEVVKTLNGVYAYDWASFLKTRLNEHAKGAPLDGIRRGGYDLVYTDTPSDYFKAVESARKSTDLTYSIGAAISPSGQLTSVLWDGPLFKAGLATGAQIIAVNSKTYDADALKSAITEAKSSHQPIEFLFKFEDTFKTVKLDYYGGLRYPKLQRIEGKPALLDDILAEKK